MSAKAKIFHKQNFKLSEEIPYPHGKSGEIILINNLQDFTEKIINIYITQFIFDDGPKNFSPIGGNYGYDSQHKLYLKNYTNDSEQYVIENNMGRFNPTPQQSNKYFKYSYLEKIILPSELYKLIFFYKIMPRSGQPIRYLYINLFLTGYSQ